MKSSNQVVVTVNDKKLTLEDPSTILDLLRALNISSRGIAVELNEQIVSQSEFNQRILKHEDAVEIVTLVGGG